MEDLVAEARRLLQNSSAKTTQVNYASSIDKFIEFRESMDMGNHWPASKTEVMMYIAFMSTGGWSASSIMSHSAAISYVHRVNEWPDPSDCFVIRKMKEGCRRTHLPDTRCPITYNVLCRLVDILSSVCSSEYETIMFRATFLLAFFGFLRVGEFTSPSKSADASRIIARKDIKFHSEGMIVNLRFSKTDQRGVSYPLSFAKASNAAFCPVVAVSKFIEIRGQIEGPLFIHFNRTTLTRHQFASVLKMGIRGLGLPTSEFTSHSFRIGAATSAAMCGLSDSEIQALGRWKSSSFKLYIRPNHFNSKF